MVTRRKYEVPFKEIFIYRIYTHIDIYLSGGKKKLENEALHASYSNMNRTSPK